MMKRFCLVIVVILTATLVYADEGVRGSFDRTLNVSGAVDLEVETGSGAIRVHPGATGKVLIHGDIWARNGDAQDKVRRLQQNPPIEQSGNSIHVGRIQDSELKRNVSISYDITVPAETRLDAHTGSGAISAEGLKNSVTAHTGSGAVRASAITGDVMAETGSGSIAVEDLGANVKAHTGSGSVRGSNLGSRQGSNIRIETGSGSVSLEQVHGVLFAHTGSGHIEASGDPTGNWDLQTGSGGVTVKLPAKVGFDLRAHTGSGRITVDQPITMQGTIGNRHDVQGRVGEGGVLVQVQTGSGSSRIGSGGQQPL